jgi:hypothetical protein
MSSRNKVGRSAAARKVGRSAAARKNDLASSCLFAFSDGRRCRTPRLRNHPHFCFDHAQKEARARAAETIGEDLAYFFSGDYLSANDLSTALARIIPAVVRGDIKPKTARTVAYLAQTLLQSIRLAQHEYVNAFGSNRWRNAIANSVNENRDYLVPPKPAPPQTQASQPTAAPPPTPPTAASLAASLNVADGLVYPEPRREPGPHAQPAPPNRSATPSSTPRQERSLARLPQHHQPSPGQQTPLEPTLTGPLVSVDSKPLTPQLSPLSATLAENTGVASCRIRTHSSPRRRSTLSNLCTLITVL